jgi:PPM family protein phosphatase
VIRDVPMRVLVYGSSDTGRVRQANEDSFAIMLPPTLAEGIDALLIVADGMGGHAGGSRASTIVAETVLGAFSRSTSEPHTGSIEGLSERLTGAIRGANDAVRAASLEDYALRGMGSTATVVVMCGRHLVLGHVGDSRAYLARMGTIQQISQDHSLVAQQVRDGILSASEAEQHSQKNVLLRAIGGGQTVEVDSFILEIKPSDVVILCSDGLSNLVTDLEILHVVTTYGQPQVAAETLVSGANERGSPDNVTAVVARVASDQWVSSGRDAPTGLLGPRSAVASLIGGVDRIALRTLWWVWLGLIIFSGIATVSFHATWASRAGIGQGSSWFRAMVGLGL